MGYGYGVWLVYKDDDMQTEHISHLTIACFMKKYESQKLYNKLIKSSDKVIVNINGQSEYYFSSFYEHDTNKICSWGYNASCEKWDMYKKICNKYQCDFAITPHTSMEYGMFPKLLKPININNKKLHCKICCVDIRSDFPVDWKIIQCK
jgi:hypothetical protein